MDDLIKSKTTKPAIFLENIKKTYIQGEVSVPALKGLNLEIQEKQLVTLMGPSGSGKSTLLNILSAIESSDSGNIEIFGIKLNEANEEDLTNYRRKTIGIVFQFFHLLPYLTSLENVSLPLFLAGVPREKAIPLAKETLNMVGLSHRFTFTPKELSGGEKQRVSIARAIVHTPKLILADEPTGNLDSKSSDQIMRLFETCVKTLGITVFIVTHNEEIGKMGNINLRMKDGFLNQ